MTNIKFIDIKKHKKHIKKLYKYAFPANERVPFWLLKRLAKKENADFFGIYDKQNFIGLVYIINYKDIVFIFYLAIDENLRGQGYGTKVLSAIKEKYDNHRIVLNIEEIDSKSSNNEQRLKRKKFYQKNGFIDLNYKIREAGVMYETLCYSKNNATVDKEEYMEMMRNYFGKVISKYVYKQNK